MTLLERVKAAGNGRPLDVLNSRDALLAMLKDQVEQIVSADTLAAIMADNPERARNEIRAACRRLSTRDPWKALAPAVFRDLGADGVISGGQTMNPSTDDILREIDATPAEVVFVLPNNKNIIMAAEQCVRLVEGKQVVVLPTKTIPQGISALMVMDPEAEVEDNRAAMAEAIGRVHTSEISDFDGFAIKRGDYLALTEHQLFGTDRKLEKLLRRLAEAEAQQSAEFINIFYGQDVSEKEAQKALKLFTECCPNAEITLLSGGQPVYYYMISAE